MIERIDAYPLPYAEPHYRVLSCHAPPYRWILATMAGMAVGLVAGAALVDYGIDRGDLALMSAVTSAAVG